jgi:hypothetical protein
MDPLAPDEVRALVGRIESEQEVQEAGKPAGVTGYR